MTDAERQAKRRASLRQQARDRARRDGPRAPSVVRPPPDGYAQAKQALQESGHCFERTRREWGFEEGVFVDGVLVTGADVVMLAAMPPPERKQGLDDRRPQGKHHAIHAVRCYMDMMRVGLDDLLG